MKSRRAGILVGWKSLLIAVLLLLIFGFGILDLFVMKPQLAERERQERREGAPRLVRPSLRVEGEAGRKVVTAFRVDEWRVELGGEPADVYLGGYLKVQAAEAALEEGDLEVALNSFEEADRVFARVARTRPDFEPEMVAFRREKIADAVERIRRGEVGIDYVPGDFDSAEPPTLPGSRKIGGAALVGGDPADHYLRGYLLVQDAEARLGQGKLRAAREAFAEAARIFEGLREGMPSFEPDMVDFRRRKIQASLAELEAGLPEAGGPQSSIEGTVGEMQVARN